MVTLRAGLKSRRSALTLGVHLPRADAHPHILIDARTELLFNAQGQVVGVSNIWDFDDAFSAYAIQGYDSKGDGKPTKEDLQPFAEITNSLKEYGYFTRMKVDGVNIGFAHPKNYFDIFANEKLTLTFTLPLAKPLESAARHCSSKSDEGTHFAAITFAQHDPVKLVGASAGCESLRASAGTAGSGDRQSTRRHPGQPTRAASEPVRGDGQARQCHKGELQVTFLKVTILKTTFHRFCAIARRAPQFWLVAALVLLAPSTGWAAPPAVRCRPAGRRQYAGSGVFPTALQSLHLGAGLF